jgi:hypothetical protein
VTSLFCRHNRFTADCPICSKDTVLDPSRQAARPRGRGSGSTRRPRGSGSRAGSAGGAFRGPYASAGPYERDGERYEVRLERVPGGLRMAEWGGGGLLRRAPVLPAADVAQLIADAAGREVLPDEDATALVSAIGPDHAGTRPAVTEGDGDSFGASPGKAGLMREELRVERLDGGLVRIARWTFRPDEGWAVNEAPPMFPAERYAEALGAAAARGLLG